MYMAILQIARMGRPVLRRPAEPVADPSAPEIRRLADDMLETMIDASGLGLAAPQVHVGLRVIVFRVLPMAAAEAEPGVRVLVNPTFEPLDDTLESGWEGCLSIPDIRGKVRRYGRIRYRGVTPDGVEVDCVATGLHARVVQHEVDHLDGVLYLDRMSDLSSLTFVDEWGDHDE